jgi:MFS family permease
MLRFLPTCYWGMAGVLLPLLIREAAGTNTAVAWYLTGSSILASLSQMAVGQAVDRWGFRVPTLGAFVALVLGIGGLALSAQHLWGLYAFGMLAACGAWSLSTLTPTLLAQVTDAGERGRVLGFLQLLWNAGMILGALIGGALVEIVVGMPFLIAAVLNVVALGLAYRFLHLAAKQK